MSESHYQCQKPHEGNLHFPYRSLSVMSPNLIYIHPPVQFSPPIPAKVKRSVPAKTAIQMRHKTRQPIRTGGFSMHQSQDILGILWNKTSLETQTLVTRAKKCALKKGTVWVQKWELDWGSALTKPFMGMCSSIDQQIIFYLTTTSSHTCLFLYN